MATTSWASLSIPYVNPSKLSDSSYVTAMNTNATFFQENFFAYAYLYMYLRGQSSMVDKDTNSFATLFDDIESKLGALHTDLGTQEGVGYKLQNIYETIQEMNDSTLSYLISYIDSSISALRDEMLDELRV